MSDNFTQYVVLIGSPRKGYKIFGTFSDQEEAFAWVKSGRDYFGQVGYVMEMLDHQDFQFKPNDMQREIGNEKI